MKLYGEAIQVDRSSQIIILKLLFNQLLCHSKLNHPKQAIENLNEALTKNPKYYKGLIRRAQLSIESELYGEAILDINDTLKIDETDQA